MPLGLRRLRLTNHCNCAKSRIQTDNCVTLRLKISCYINCLIWESYVHRSPLTIQWKISSAYFILCIG
jgi:hypothetical protein